LEAYLAYLSAIEIVIFCSSHCKQLTQALETNFAMLRSIQSFRKSYQPLPDYENDKELGETLAERRQCIKCSTCYRRAFFALLILNILALLLLLRFTGNSKEMAKKMADSQFTLEDRM